ncbi:ISSfl2 ORF [Shigella sonnei]|nr:Mobile element protein [Shigella sonnei]CSK80213.1 ISSfl2 ORF [Shigella sonnei]SRH71154.1 ISSfl2 ORF [Shigella sonnei]SRH74468.1 ISSfl2 ORF [Shigella sonnei]SRH90387.1 ISSfl2 ORF [Shigella sonnei]
MRRIADLHAGEAKTDARDAAIIAEAARTLPHVRIPLYSITDWHRSSISDSHPFDQPGT